MAVNYTLSMLDAEGEARANILALLAEYADELKPGSSIAELGCGNGRNLKIFKERGHQVLGVDGLAEAVEKCKSQGIPAECLDFNGPLNLQGSWDLVLILDVLEHLETPAHLLEKAKAMLSPGGRILVNVPNHFTLQGRIRILLGSGIDSERFFPSHPEWAYPHLRFFSHSGIKELAGEVGLAVVADKSKFFMRTPAVRLIPDRLIRALWGSLPVDLSVGGFFLELVEC